MSPNRILRPWSGAFEKLASFSEKPGSKDTKHTALAPGATRSNGAVNSLYKGTYVFPNDFPALVSHGFWLIADKYT